MSKVRRGGAAMLAAAALVAAPAVGQAAQFSSDWSNHIDRPWAGEHFWTNPVKDWRLQNGRLVCINPKNDRNVQMLTHQLGDRQGNFEMTVEADVPTSGPDGGWLGLRAGIEGAVDDHRAAVINGRGGLNAGLTNDGRLFVGNPGRGEEIQTSADRLQLTLAAEENNGNYNVTLTASEPGGQQIARTAMELNPGRLVGNIALVAHRANPNGQVSFSGFQVSGDKVVAHTDHAFGPIFFAMHTLSDSTLKLTAQMAPVGRDNNRTVQLQTKRGGDWQTVDKAEIHEYARTAEFQVDDWDDTEDVPYRVAYNRQGGGDNGWAYWEGTIRKNPVDQRELTVAGFTGHKDYTFPNNEIVNNLEHHDPDMLVFTGDQFYEDSGGYGAERTNTAETEEELEYLSLDLFQHWIPLGWSFGDLMRDRPTLCLTDDHDVYQGNIWGAGGRNVENYASHAQGGYLMPAEWVNIVERTQTSYMPASPDPSPVKQGIGVYYGETQYGRISFAVLEDRKWKSGPEGLAPETDTDRPDHMKDENFDRERFDVPGARLLGQRQLDFIRDWTADWENTDMKIAVSQSIFAQVPNIHGGNQMRLAADLDSHGWPQSPRDRVVRELRKGFAFHLSGDQHLPMIVQYGVTEWGDAGYTFCVPSIAAGYPRAFRPEEPGKNRESGAPAYTGQHYDGLGNKFTAYAIANPADEIRSGLLKRQHDKRSGYGLLKLDKQTQQITIESWGLLADAASDGNAGQMKGWPHTIEVKDNYGREARAHLPTIEVAGMEDPVVQLELEHTGEHVYTRRMLGNSFRPKVFRDHYSYTVRIGEPGTDQWRELTGVEPTEDEEATIEVSF